MLRKLSAYHIENGTDALVICGTTGESSTMTQKEQAMAVETVVEAIHGRIPVIAGVGGNDTTKVMETCKAAASIGADAVLAVTPYYNKTTQKGLVAHFQAVADSSQLPVILYNVPSRTGMNLKPETAAVLSEHENIIGNKEASGDIAQVSEVVRLCGDRLPIYSGNDEITLPILALGGAGVISVAANILPRVMHDLCTAFFEGELQKAREIQLALLPLISALFLETSPAPVKEAMSIMGFEVGEARLPLVCVENETVEKIREAMKAWDVIT